MQEYLEKRRELEEIEYEKYDEEYDRLIDYVCEIYKNEVNSLLNDLKVEIYKRESEIGFDLEINERELLNLVIDEL